LRVQGALRAEPPVINHGDRRLGVERHVAEIPPTARTPATTRLASLSGELDRIASSRVATATLPWLQEGDHRPGVICGAVADLLGSPGWLPVEDKSAEAQPRPRTGGSTSLIVSNQRVAGDLGPSW
jgi:hypothetical protein